MPQALLAVLVGLAVSQIATFATTVYLHRAVTHKALALTPGTRLAFRALIWVTTGIRPRQWAAVHRRHHAFTDVEGDPHSPLLLGFWKVQLGNVILYRRSARDGVTVQRYARDLPPDRLDRVLFDHAFLGLAIGIGILVAALGWEYGLFCSLAAWARSVEDAELAEWWPERRCAAEWGDVVRPDGFGTLRHRGVVVELFVEVDRGTETLTRLADKLTGYAALVHATGWAPLVCFWFPSPGREAEARPVLAHPGVPVATGAASLGDPAGAGGTVWLPVGQTAGPRRHLIDLAPTRRRP